MAAFYWEKEQDQIWEMSVAKAGDLPYCSNLPAELRRVEIKNIRNALEFNNGIIAKAAIALGISRERLHYRIKALEINL